MTTTNNEENNNSKTNTLVPDNFFTEFEDNSEDTSETVVFIPQVSHVINYHQNKYELYDKIVSMLSITKYNHFLIYTKEKMPYKEDFLYKKIVGVRINKELDIPLSYEHHGLFSDGPSDITIAKVKPYESVYVEIKVCNQDGSDAKWVKCENLANIMVKSIEYSVIQ